MSIRPAPRRRRLLALATTGAALLAGSGLAAVAAPASAAPPAPDCAVAFPVSEVTADQPVTGLTVVSGTTPTGFTGDVLGVLENGIAPDVDMIMIDLDMPEFARTGGVWSGMSGSPVYAEDGRLLGAVAYGLAAGPSPIAGITPFEDMDDRLGGGLPDTVRVSRSAATMLASEAGTTRAEAGRGFAALPVPTAVSGVSTTRLAQARQRAGAKRGYLAADTYAVGTAAAAQAGPETLTAGGNLAVSASYGDVFQGGVGTVTSVCGDRVVGFGHPAFYTGSTALGLHPASSLYIQPDSLGAPFKVANITDIAGTVTDDRLAGVTGTVGALPATRGVTSKASYDGRSRTGTTRVVLPTADAMASTTLYQVLGNVDRVLDGTSRGTAVQGWRITGTDRGRPFSLAFTDRFTGSDLLFEPAFPVADLVYTLDDLEGVDVGGVAVTTQVDDSVARYGVQTVQQRRQGRWVTVTGRAPVVAKAGKTVRLRALLTGTAGSRTVAIPPISIPRKARGVAQLVVQGGNDVYSGFYGDTVASIRDQVARAQRHDEVRVQLGTEDRLEIGFDEEEFLFRSTAPGKGAEAGRGDKPGKGKPGKGKGGKGGKGKGQGQGKGRGGKPVSFLRAVDLGPLDHVVGGSAILDVRIR